MAAALASSVLLEIGSRSRRFGIAFSGDHRLDDSATARPPS